ncbi:MAG: hypothetical protein C4299_02805 [Thermoleophilia bacterium]
MTTASAGLRWSGTVSTFFRRLGPSPPSSATGCRRGKLLLADITVVEYAQFVAGPFCGKILAGLGAEVIKVEPPAGDIARRRGPFLDRRPGLETSALFLYLT